MNSAKDLCQNTIKIEVTEKLSFSGNLNFYLDLFGRTNIYKDKYYKCLD